MNTSASNLGTKQVLPLPANTIGIYLWRYRAHEGNFDGWNLGMAACNGKRNLYNDDLSFGQGDLLSSKELQDIGRHLGEACSKETYTHAIVFNGETPPVPLTISHIQLRNPQDIKAAKRNLNTTHEPEFQQAILELFHNYVNEIRTGLREKLILVNPDGSASQDYKAFANMGYN